MGKRTSPVLVPAGIIGVLVVAAVALVVFAITRPEPPGFVPTPVGQLPAPDAHGARTVTVDASSPDAWRFFSFERGILPGRATGEEWDLAFRRFHIIANGGRGFAGKGAVADLGDVSFDTVLAIPSAPLTKTTITGGDSINTAIDRWYRYGFTSHLLTPLPRTYAVRSASGAMVKLQVLGYYCPRATPGCVTIRWTALNDKNAQD